MDMLPAPIWSYPLGYFEISAAVLFFLGSIFVYLMQINSGIKEVAVSGALRRMLLCVQCLLLLVPYIPLLATRLVSDSSIFFLAAVAIAAAQIFIFPAAEKAKGGAWQKAPSFAFLLSYFLLFWAAKYDFYNRVEIVILGIAAFAFVKVLDKIVKKIQSHKQRMRFFGGVFFILALLAASHVYMQVYHHIPCCRVKHFEDDSVRIGPDRKQEKCRGVCYKRSFGERWAQ